MSRIHPQAGELRHKTAIYRLKDEDEQELDAGGNAREEDNEFLVGHRYAAFRTARRGFNIDAANQTKEVVSHTIIMRNDSLTRKITSEHWFVRNGVRYDIVAAPDEQFRERPFVIFDCRSVGGE